MSSSYNFKDNLTVDNNKYMKWLDKTGTTRANIVALDNNNNVNINSAFGDVNINGGAPGSFTFINSGSSGGNVLVGTRLGVGFTTTENIAANLTLVKNGVIGVNTTVGTSDGFLGLSGSFGLTNDSGSRIVLYGNNHVGNPGNIHMYSGNVANGNINLYTGADSLKFQILQNGTFNFIPDGVTTRLTINNAASTFTNDLTITSTTQSFNSSTGALQIRGGIGIKGNLYVDGTISLNSATGNINFDSTQTSTSYTTGAIFISGGMGISTTVNASSISAGGALSIAGGAAFGKDVYIGGSLSISSTAQPINSQTGSLVVYGGMGINGSILSRSDASQIQIAPKTTGATSEIQFFSTNNFTSSSAGSSSWRIGQRTGAVGTGNFGIWNSDFGTILGVSYGGGSDFYGNVTILDSTNATGEDDGGSLTVSGGAAFKKDVYIGGSVTFAGGSSIGGGGGGGAASQFGYLTLTATDDAINLSTGSLVTFGGITIQSPTDAVSLTNGGSFLTDGGASIGKSLFVGGPVMKIPVGDSASRPSPGIQGTIRYNSTTSQFEGFGPGGAWGSLGGVIDIAQTTKVLASASPSTTDGNLYFFTVDVERMRINSAGNIGIATTAPAAPLHVGGGIMTSMAAVANAGTNHMTFSTTSTRIGLALGGNETGSNAGSDFKINTYSDAGNFINTMFVLGRANGNVGIGTGSPSVSDKLHVGGCVRIDGATATQGVGQVDNANMTNTYITFGEAGGTTDWAYLRQIGNSNNLKIALDIHDDGDEPGFCIRSVKSTDNPDTINERFTVNMNGNVGIGTTSPIANLHVPGTTILGNSNTIGNIFTTGGNVGINIAAPAYHLDVNGNVHINADLYVDGQISGGAGTGSTYAYLTLTSTDDAINLSTGSLVTFGGITIQSQTDAMSITNGGSFLTSGGASIGRRLFVGDSAYLGNDLTVTNTVTILSSQDAIGVGSGGSLTVLGGASISSDLYVGGTVTSSSDIRLKQNVHEFNSMSDTRDMLDKIANLRTIKYNYRNDPVQKLHVGFVAQDFIQDFPELLRCPPGGYYSLDYQKVTVILVECVKELRDEVSRLRSELRVKTRPKRRGIGKNQKSLK